MTTSRSPLSALTKQAMTIAKMLKQAERGEALANDPAGKIAAARRRESVKFSIMMDDKFLACEMAWKQIEATSEVGLAQYILRYMRGQREAMH